MRPVNQKLNKRKTGEARARMLIEKNLGWLNGFPAQRYQVDGLDAMVVVDSLRANLAWSPRSARQEGQLILIDRERIRESEIALKKLSTQYTRVMPRIVENVEEWTTRTQALLELFKGFVHDQDLVSEGIDILGEFSEAVFPQRWLRRLNFLCQKEKQLLPVVTAIVFSEAGSLNRPSLEPLEWLENHLDLFRSLLAVEHLSSEIVNSLAFTLFQVRNEMPESLLQRVVRAIGDSDLALLDFDDCCRYVEEIEVQLGNLLVQVPFTPPCRNVKTTLWKILFDCLFQCRSFRQKKRGRYLRLLEALFTDDLVSSFSEARCEIELHESEMQGKCRAVKWHHYHPALAQRINGTPKQKDTKITSSDSKIQWSVSSENTFQVVYYFRDLIAFLPMLSDARRRSEVWTSFLQSFKNEAQIKAAVFWTFEEKVQQQDESFSERDFMSMLKCLGGVFRKHGLPVMMQTHWGRFLSGRGMRDFVEDLLSDEPNKRSGHAKTIALIEKVVELDPNACGNLERNFFQSLFEFAKVMPLDFAAKVVVQLCDLVSKDRYFDCDLIQLASQLSSCEVTVAKSLAEMNNEHCWETTLKGLDLENRKPYFKQCISRLVTRGDFVRVQNSAMCLKILSGFDCELPDFAEYESDSRWMAKYPADLQPSLAELSRVTMSAESVASEILSTNFPDQQKLANEREKIALILEQEDLPDSKRIGLQKRFQRLTKTCESIKPVGIKRLENLADKIWQRVNFEFERRLESESRAALDRTLFSKFSKEFVGQLFEKPLRDVLHSICELDEPMRELGLKLISHLGDPDASSLESAPVNVNFLAKIEGKGVFTTPWLDPDFAVKGKTESGKPYRVAFTRDVLDYFLMGHHFDTCLSPGNCNFFSTIANALDVNKQVAYARTDDGAVVGRCLFTLSNSGTILVYHRYCHNAGDGFENAIRQFANELAARMKTKLESSNAGVAKLLAKQWYDDCAAPLEVEESNADHSVDLESDESVVKKLLTDAKVDSPIQEIISIFGERSFRAHFNQFMRLDYCWSENAALEYIRHFQIEQTLTTKNQIELALLAHDLDHPDISRQLLDRVRGREILRCLQREYCSDCPELHCFRRGIDRVIAMLSDYNASLALRFLRNTRSRWVRTDLHESNVKRKELLALVHRKLGRTRIVVALGHDELCSAEPQVS